MYQKFYTKPTALARRADVKFGYEVLVRSKAKIKNDARRLVRHWQGEGRDKVGKQYRRIENDYFFVSLTLQNNHIFYILYVTMSKFLNNPRQNCIYILCAR